MTSENAPDDALIALLRCPRTHLSLEWDNGKLRSSDGSQSYSLLQGSPDLRAVPSRLQVDLPWFEPWDELDAIDISKPNPVSSPDLPFHLDGHLASIPGDDGGGRRILEVGCGERQCEGWFEPRGFEYVGTDVDLRGIGPHLLADAHNLPFQSESFDFYTSMAVYEHLISPITAAVEAFRVLKPGGTFFGSSAFVYGFHDRASFHHMTHAGLFCTLRAAGFTVERMWDDWSFTRSIPEMAFRGGQGAPWRLATAGFLSLAEWSFTGISSLARKLGGKPPLKLPERAIEMAGSVSFCARKPGSRQALNDTR